MDTYNNIYKDIACRTQGDIYIGVVGPVRTGKSTFIKKFMEKAVIPKIENEHKRARALDELPQSSGGRTIMTTEPKFIPNEAVEISIGDSTSFKMRMIDCVGYIVESARGYIEEENPRMVVSPWADEPIPFSQAAEIGTGKVIGEHSTIGIVVTCDGSITDIEREDYVQAEERVINELKALNKPFVVILNSTNPHSPQTVQLKSSLEEKYKVTVIPLSCMDLTEDDINSVMTGILYDFPLSEVTFNMPQWILSLADGNNLKSEIQNSVFESTEGIFKISDALNMPERIATCPYIEKVFPEKIDAGKGIVSLALSVPDKFFYQTVKDLSGFDIFGKSQLLALMQSLAEMKCEYDKISSALEQVKHKGYGIVTPSIDELTLEEPEIVKQGSRFGVRLKASAPSIHINRYKPKFLKTA